MAEIPNSHGGADGASAPKPLMMFYQKDGEITAHTLNGAGVPTAITTPAASTTPPQSRDLQHYWNLLKRYRWALVLSVAVCTSISAYIALHTPRVYSASSTILISGKDASRALLVPEIGVSGPNNDLNTQVIVIKALAVMKIASDMLKAQGLPLSPASVSGSVMVENIPDTSVITVTADAGHPQDAARIANAVARAYVQYQLNRARQSDTTTVGFLDKELTTANETLAKAEKRLLAFQDQLARMGMDVTEGSSAGTSGAPAPITSTASSDLRAAQTALQSALQQQFIDQQHISDARKKLSQLASALVSQQSSAIQNNNMVYTLQTQLEEKEGELADARTRLSPAGVQKLYPGLVEEVARLRNLLNRQVSNLAGGNTVDLNLQQSLNTQLYQAQGDLNTIQPQIPALRQRVATLSTQVLQEPGLAVRLNRLVRDRDVSQSVYQMLLERQKQVQISQAAVQSDASVISTATIPSMPIRPDRKREIIIGIFVGLALGILAIYLLDFLDTSVRTWSDVREKVGLPVLGAIPAGEVLPATVWEKFHRSLAAEAYRMLRSNISFVNVDSEVKTIMVTSSGPREGKSSTISNLAAAMAQEGKRVVVVDADMRKPSIHRLLGGGHSIGLAEVLSGAHTMEEALRESVVPGVWTIPVDKLPPNPAELLSGQRMRDLLATLRQQFDVVLIDTPPALMVADALILASRCDAVIQVMAAGRTTTRAATRARQAIEEAHGNVVGAVLNFCTTNDGDDYYSYYYYYDYGASNGSKGLARFFHPQRRARLSSGADRVDEEVRR